MIADLPGSSYHYPPQIGCTDDQPDIVVWDDTLKQVYLIELSVCFETNFEAARKRKVLKYVDLAEQHNYKCDVFTVEVGSRGVVEVERMGWLRRVFDVGKKKWDTFLVQLAETVIKESHKIWSMRNWTDQPKS